MNDLTDLNKILFKRLEALDEDMSEESLQREIQKSEATAKLADTILKNAQLALKAQELFTEYGTGQTVDIPLLGISNDYLIMENRKLRNELQSRGKL